ncbi:probable peroxisomal acyl-coenzyme A oxidase 1 [Bombyx mandarina]|uniref:Acyl-coenzyme A oxidase n=1 Tax=Bombyx mandarina TaxID=7092 RepID=A0A6J2JTD3_BOMMA|nr:probable peroxisomal acyl-coenzyme A oxidase 1 [Bombyx mandarina]
MARTVVDLANERKKCDFDVEELTNYIDGDAISTHKRRQLENKVLSVKELFDVVPEEYLSHKEKYENAIRKSVLLYKVLEEIKDPNETEMQNARTFFRSLLPFAIFKDNSPFSLHYSMFVPAIIAQANDEQKKYWLKRAMNTEIIGTYAQTELGHGTFIRGLETTATYDVETEEFVLHSPTLTAYKWWPGSLAHTANYCVVMAQLNIKGKNYGIQPFMVQLRDENTHMPLSGIKLGEIGAKLGFNTVNNGFLGFDQHRIPRDRMLMKNAQVSKDGVFTRKTDSKLTYGTMVYVRVMIVNSMANHLARSVTIAVRYSAVRKQSQINTDQPEVQVMDFLTQQHKLFVAIASSHAIRITAAWLWDKYEKVTKDMEAGKSDGLPELHALACCLKAVSSADASDMVITCSRACGGHGYILSSNLPQIYGLIAAACIYEGENTVLLLQTARSLVKAWEQNARGEKLSSTVSYIADTRPFGKWENSVEGIIKGFERVAACKLSAAVSTRNKYLKSGLSPEESWNMTSVQLVAVSEAHCRALILSTYKAEVDRKAQHLSAPLKRAMYQLVELYATYWSLQKLGDLLLYTSMSESDVQQLRQNYESLLLKIRPNAVGLVDGFDFRDEILNSTLGAYDGRVYERLMEEALKSPLNAEPVNRSFHQYLKPFMQGKL